MAFPPSLFGWGGNRIRGRGGGAREGGAKEILQPHQSFPPTPLSSPYTEYAPLLHICLIKLLGTRIKKSSLSFTPRLTGLIISPGPHVASGPRLRGITHIRTDSGRNIQPWSDMVNSTVYMKQKKGVPCTIFFPARQSKYAPIFVFHVSLSMGRRTIVLSGPKCKAKSARKTAERKKESPSSNFRSKLAPPPPLRGPPICIVTPFPITDPAAILPYSSLHLNLQRKGPLPSIGSLASPPPFHLTLKAPFWHRGGSIGGGGGEREGGEARSAVGRKKEKGGLRLLASLFMPKVPLVSSLFLPLGAGNKGREDWEGKRLDKKESVKLKEHYSF